MIVSDGSDMLKRIQSMLVSLALSFTKRALF